MICMRVQTVIFPPVDQSISQDLEITFNNRQYNIPLYKASVGLSGLEISMLSNVTMELSMVSIPDGQLGTVSPGDKRGLT